MHEIYCTEAPNNDRSFRKEIEKAKYNEHKTMSLGNKDG